MGAGVAVGAGVAGVVGPIWNDLLHLDLVDKTIDLFFLFWAIFFSLLFLAVAVIAVGRVRRVGRVGLGAVAAARPVSARLFGCFSKKHEFLFPSHAERLANDFPLPVFFALKQPWKQPWKQQLKRQ